MYYKIKTLCDMKGISITTLEKEVGLGNGSIGKWKESSPKVDSLKLVADYFKKPLDYFLDQEDDMIDRKRGGIDGTT